MKQSGHHTLEKIWQHCGPEQYVSVPVEEKPAELLCAGVVTNCARNRNRE